MLSQFFVMSPRGDTIIAKNYRGEVDKTTAETFFRTVKFWKGDPPPAFDVDGNNFIFLLRGGLHFVFVTKYNVSPSLAVELLERLTRAFKDYCGVLTEEAIRKNFVLIYELLDEMLDFGYPQLTSTESLKLHVHSDPVPVSSAPATKFRIGQGRTISAAAVHRPMSLMGGGSTGKKNEIFVDILERLTVLFNSSGYLLNSTIDGCIQMKSYLSGNPPLRLALNEDLVVGKELGAGAYGAVVLDDANFHECVNLDDFESTRAFTLVPPDGEFTVMNYRMTGEFRAPFRVFPYVEEAAGSAFRAEFVLKVRCDIPAKNHGTNVVVRFPVPKAATNVTPDVRATGAAASGGSAASAILGSKSGIAGAGQTAEYDAKKREVVWIIRKFAGGTEQTLRCGITLGSAVSGSIRKELGPISLQFEIPMYSVSGLAVRYLRIAEPKSYKPHRWVRYVTTSESYVCRL